MTHAPVCSSFPASSLAARLLLFVAFLASAWTCAAQEKPVPKPAPDELVLSNGDTLHGKLISFMGGKVTFHTDSLGDVTLGWDKIKELHTAQKFAVIDKTVKFGGGKAKGQIPTGSLDVVDQNLILHAEAPAVVAPIPAKNVQYVIDEPTLNKQVFHEPGFFTGWNGAATAGATVVTGSQNQYTFSGGIGLVRAVPTVAWLNPRNRTSADLSGSYGKITQPGYNVPAVPPSTTPTFVPAVVTKSSIIHVDGERDEFISPRFFGLVQVAFDHNYSQDLNLQQIYGGGIGWTAFKTPKQEGDLKSTVQYERQQFISGSGNLVQNLIGSTFSATYALQVKRVVFTQKLAYIPAWNVPAAYSANEANTVAFPVFKNLSFSLGTMDSYLNDSPASLPPTKPNSFQFTMGLTYAIKSKY